MPINPTSDLVGVAWIASIPGIQADKVATNLPRDQLTWKDTGFITVNTIAGDPHLYLPIRRPVVQVDCWGVNPNSDQPPWGRTNALAELIRAHLEETPRPASFYRALSFAGSIGYRQAVVMQAIMRTEPRRGIVLGAVPAGDEASYARYMFDLELHWRVVL